ncbi:FecR domain-containing protein [Bryobacter aggregatus]|uniref:FecR domain-containing protein n=1 Tax=Bryobacter aggregatus TaxID=360054 RepID=UPI0004E27A1B|nr:FecR domain-containing protein [Bryobacter aggregatus]
MKRIILAAIGTLISLTPGLAQSVISAKAGVIHYVEGDVNVDDTKLVMQTSKFPDLKNHSVLRTAEGRVEILLSPGSFLRLSDSSAVRMESNSLAATKLSLLEGTALVEVAEIAKDTSLELVMGDSTITIRKAGLYRLEMNPPAVKVYNGEVAVNSRNELQRVTEGKMLALSGEMQIAKFDKKQNTDELVQWADRRSATMAMANVHSAKSLGSSFSSGSLSGFSPGMSGGWFYNSYFGMMTFIPFGRSAISPFGYGYYTPVTVISVYRPDYSGSLGGNSGGNGIGGFADRRSVGFDSNLGYNTSSMRSSTGYTGGTGSGPAISGGERGAAAGAAGGGAGRAAGGGGGAAAAGGGRR